MIDSAVYKLYLTFALIFISLVNIGCNPYKQETELIKVYAQRIDESSWSDQNFKMVEIEYIKQITAIDSLNILEDQIRQSVQSTNDFLAEMMDEYESTLKKLKRRIAQEPSTPLNKAKLRRFYEQLMELQAVETIIGLPESFNSFSDAFTQTSYRSELFGFFKRLEDDGVLSGFPNTLQEFQDPFWPEEPPIDSVKFVGLECINGDYYSNLKEKIRDADINYIFELEERIKLCEAIITSNNDYFKSGDIQTIDYLSGRLSNRFESLKLYHAKPDSILGHIFKCIYEVDDPSLDVRKTVTGYFLLNNDRTEVLKRLKNGTF